MGPPEVHVQVYSQVVAHSVGREGEVIAINEVIAVVLERIYDAVAQGVEFGKVERHAGGQVF